MTGEDVTREACGEVATPEAEAEYDAWAARPCTERDPCGDHSEGDHFEVTQTLIVTAPRGEHGEAIRRAFALWGQPETRTNAEHNLLATHHSSTTVRVTAERNTRG